MTTTSSTRSRLAAALLAVAVYAVPTLTSPSSAVADDHWAVPVPPPRCTSEQAASGDVGGCLLAFYGYAGSKGWGEPPAPGVGPGWVYSNSTYSGSPALADFEAAYIASNAAPIGAMPIGEFEIHVAAQPLFEGFLNEITARGYAVDHASGYSFRCTSGNGGWNCPSGDTDDLSLHAWGLAIDMNSSRNPIRTYSSINGESACLTPMVSDLPQWVIQAAEKWGLYWGGYGWNSGCNVAGAERTSVTRDAPHFEFRGTPEQAAAIARFNAADPADKMCRTVVDDDGDDVQSCNYTGLPDAGERLPVAIDAPAGTEAVLVNVTATGANSPGFLTLEDCDARVGDRTTSALTFAANETVATMAIVPVDETQRFCVYRSSAVHSIVDVVAVISPDSADDTPLWLQPGTPNRLLDTRDTETVVPGENRSLPGDAAGRLVNLAAVGRGQPGFLQAGMCDELGPEANFSNVNYAGSEVRSNLTIISESDAAACVYSLAKVDVVVDELGTLDAADGLGWSVTDSRRVLDTRTDSPTAPKGGSLIRIDLDTEAPAAALAITVTDTAAPGFVSVGRCDELSAVIDANGGPSTSNLNHMTGQTVTNLAIVQLDQGEMCAFTHATAHVVIDVQAELVDDQGAGLVVGSPSRVLDSRSVDT